jgi:probable HAF family extracellular repeat protein
MRSPYQIVYLLLLFAPLTSRGEVRYAITDLGNLTGGSASSVPLGMNQVGQVVGESYVNSIKHAFFHDGSAMIDLTVLAGNQGTFGSAAGSASGVNGQGEVVGFATSTPNGFDHAFYWNASEGIRDLGTLGGLTSHAYAINEGAQVVGDSQRASGVVHAFVWTTSGGMTDIGSLAGNSWAYAINNSGQVVGYTGTPSGRDRAFLWSSSDGMIELGTLGGWHSGAYGINALGQVVGYAYTSDDGGNDRQHAFVWSPQTGMLDLGTLGGRSSTAQAVNDLGQVVGYSNVPGSSLIRAFLYDNGSMLQLDQLVDPVPGWRFVRAPAIDASGRILVEAVLPNSGFAHALVLTPIPEPTAVLYVSAGMWIQIAQRRRGTPRRSLDPERK